MPFEIPSDLHPDLMPIAFLLGHWHGNGHGDYPTIEAFEFRQEVGFTHDGRPFLHYLSRTWLLDDDGNDVRPLALETGFFRPQPEGAIEVLLTHPTGYRRDLLRHGRGRQDRARHRRRRAHQSAKEYRGGHRLYGLVEGDLLWTFDMAAVGQELQSHIWARLQRDGEAIR